MGERSAMDACLAARSLRGPSLMWKLASLPNPRTDDLSHSRHQALLLMDRMLNARTL